MTTVSTEVVMPDAPNPASPAAASEPRYFTRSNKRKEPGADSAGITMFKNLKRKPDQEDKSSFDDRNHQRIRNFVAMAASMVEGEDAEDFTTISEGFVLSRIPPKKHKEEIIKCFWTLLTAETKRIEDYAFPAEVMLGIKIPRSVREAMASEHGKEWAAGMRKEIDSLVANGTWEEYVRPKGANLVSTKWVFTVKGEPGNITEFKCRLVARGFTQEHGTDYFETFAPTVRMDTLRLFLAVAAKENLEISHFDIKNAFTESKLKEDIYLKPPEGVKVTEGMVLKALRSLYGLKQAGRDWNKLLEGEVLKAGFVKSLADPCLFVNRDMNITILIYVDDILASAKDQKSIDCFYSVLTARFKAKDLGPVKKILGVRVTRNRATRELWLDQENYLEDVLNEFGYPNGKHHGKPIPMSDYSNLRPSREEDERIDAMRFQKGVGRLMYAMVLTRVDIAFSLGRLATYMHDPSVHHGNALKDMFRYLRSTVSQKLYFGPAGKHQDHVGIYTDADWASDKSDRKSISGGVGMFYGGCFCWAGRKQGCVACSTCEAEYVSQAMFSRQGQWVAQILRDLNRAQYISENKKTVLMYGDNQGAIALTKNPHLHERSKHIDVCYHYVRDLAEKQRLEITYIPTIEMAADGLTKPLQRVAFERWKKILGLDH